jgi:adenylate cyclase class IV
MMFGQVNDTPLDIRIRVTNGKCEVVSKAGVFGSHNRTETATSILPEEFLNTVKVFSQLGFKTKVGERQQQNFSLPNDVTVTTVQAKHIAYIELEKISSPEKEEEDKAELDKLAQNLNLRLIENEDTFQELVTRLSNEVDWMFSHTDHDYEQIAEKLREYLP